MNPLVLARRFVASMLLCLAPAFAWAGGGAMAIGGAVRDENAEVWQRLIELAGGKGARFVVFGTASSDPDGAAAKLVTTLERYGAVAEPIRVAPKIAGIDLEAAVRDPLWIAKVRAARGVFFSGGEQERLMDTLRPGGKDTPLLEAIRAVFAAGGVIAGTSSGAAVMSEVAVRDIRSPLAVLQGAPLRDGQEVGAGFGFVPAGVVIDQHFIKRGRIGRLLPLLAARSQALGIGVEEDSAAIVRDGALEVVGARGVLVADMTSAKVAGLKPFAATGMRLHWLQSGDRMQLATRAVTPSAAKLKGTVLLPNAPGHRGYHGGEAFFADILGDGMLVNAMARLVDGDQREIRGLAFDALAKDGDGFEWRFHIGPDTRGWVGRFGDEVTLTEVLLDVRPVQVARPLYPPR